MEISGGGEEVGMILGVLHKTNLIVSCGDEPIALRVRRRYVFPSLEGENQPPRRT